MNWKQGGEGGAKEENRGSEIELTKGLKGDEWPKETFESSYLLS